MNNISQHLSTLGEEAKAKGKVAAFCNFVNNTIAPALNNGSVSQTAARVAIDRAAAIVEINMKF